MPGSVRTPAQKVLPSARQGGVPLCRHCGRPEAHHGKMVGTCFRHGKALATVFSAESVFNRNEQGAKVNRAGKKGAKGGATSARHGPWTHGAG